MCTKLLEKYFVNEFKNEQIKLSFTQLINFLKLLGFYLFKFSQNPFFNPLVLKDVSQSLNTAELRKIIIESREKIVTSFIESARKTVSNSVKRARHSQQTAFRELNQEQLQNELEVYMDNLLVNFVNCNYLIFFFSEPYADLNLVYADKKVLTKEIISFFKSQDTSKYFQKKRFSEFDLLKYINDTQDTNIFADYRKLTHEELYEKLKNTLIANTKADYKLPTEKFAEDAESLKRIDKINQDLSKILLKLENYILSSDNFVKMILIYNKIKSNLPVVIVGETGCGKTSLIAYLAIKVLHVKFIVFNIHSGINQDLFMKQMNHYITISRRLDEEIWIFFDEFNTSEAMFLISEMICHRTLLGSPIPANLKFLAACNPYKVRSQAIDIGLVMQRNNSKLVHNVHPLPESLIDHIWDYGSLCEEDEKNYIGTMILSLKLENHDLIKKVIYNSHKFVRGIEDVSSVSLRDVDRFRIFYKWLNENTNNFSEKLDLNQEIVNTIVTCYICYIIRLSKEEHRNEYLQNLSTLLIEHGFEINANQMKKIIIDLQDFYLDKMNLPKGIAKNNALRENLFATFVSVLNNIPIFICGKPGCSKTLSVRLISSSLRGAASADDYLKKFPELFQITYQGSESSTSEGIQN